MWLTGQSPYNNINETYHEKGTSITHLLSVVVCALRVVKQYLSRFAEFESLYIELGEEFGVVWYVK